MNGGTVKNPVMGYQSTIPQLFVHTPEPPIHDF